MADLTLNPDFVLSTTPTYQTLITQFENGVEQRRPRRATVIRSFKLIFKNRSASDLSTIQTLFTAKQGAYASWTWLNPDDSNTYTVRFKEDSLTWDLVSYQIYNFQFEIIEVI